MTQFARKLLIALLAVLAALPLASGQARAAYSRAELDQMLAPIALYPDPLLSQILMAATYPEEVAEAARWSRAHPGVMGDDAVRMVQDYEWDPSVKSLVAFPQVLTRMEEHPDWTQKLGDAFIVQEPAVMEAVQGLRRRAQEAGQLASDERLRVIEQPGTIVIEPANPQYIYVPYYDPLIAYGPWWWSAYPPFYWAPWPGYVRAYRPGFWWGSPIGVSVGFFFGGVDWHRRYVRVVRTDNYYVRGSYVNRQAGVTGDRWRRDYWQRRDGQRWDGQRRDVTRQDTVTRPQTTAPTQNTAPAVREQRREDRRQEWRDERRGFAPRVQTAPQQLSAPQQFSAPRFEAAPRTETRQGWQRQPEQRRIDRAQQEPRRFEQRQQPTPPAAVAAPRFEQRQQATPPVAVAAPRVEQRREQRAERREQRVERREQRVEQRHEHSKGGHRSLN
jgi:uncharacterized protein DUF3300